MKVQRTKQIRAVRWLSTIVLFGIILTMMLPTGAWALGTAAGTDIRNQATITYEVNGTGQTPIDSIGNDAATGETVFVVDNKVVPVVVSQGDVNVSTNQTNAVLEFVLRNDGNATQGFFLESVAGATSITMTSVVVRVEDGLNGGFQPGEDAAYDPLNPPQLAADATLTVYIVADAPATATNNDTDTYWLRATTLNPGVDDDPTNYTAATPGGDTVDVVDNVLADVDADGAAGAVDGEYDGRHADSAVFTIAASNLTVTKSSAVAEDPINGTANPKAIPGAYVEYTITVSNASGAATATSVVVTDDLSTEIGNGTVVFRTNSYSGNGLIATAPDIGTDVDLTNLADADAGDWDDTAADTVTVNCGQLDADETCTVRFQVVVQ